MKNNMKVRKFNLLFFIILLYILNLTLKSQENWAFIIGNSSYKYIKHLSKIRFAENDAFLIYNTLNLPCVNFSKDKIFILDGKKNTINNFKKIIINKLSKCKKNDNVFIFFIGHSILKYKKIYLLFYDSYMSDLHTTAISFKYLLDLLDFYVPAKNIILFLDIFKEKIKYSYEKWLEVIEDENDLLRSSYYYKNIFVLYGSSPNERSQERGGYGIFSLFICNAIKGIEYLNNSPDLNDDKIISLKELIKYVINNIRFSEISQHPFFLGKIYKDIPIACLNNEKPLINVFSPKYFQYFPYLKRYFFYIDGVIRFDVPIKELYIEDKNINICFVNNPRKYNLLNYKTIYYFSSNLIIPMGKKYLNFKARDILNRIYKEKYRIKWIKRGWYKEWIPYGMRKSTNFGEYIWEKDNSKMIYIPKGKAKIGIPLNRLEKFKFDIKKIREILRKEIKYLENNEKISLILIKGLEETNESIKKISYKLNEIYKKVNLINKVNNLIIRKKIDNKDKEEFINNEEIKEIKEKIKNKDKILNKDLIKSSILLLNKCYDDLYRIGIRKQEVLQILDYLEYIINNWDIIKNTWKEKEIKINTSFYIDKYEVSNLQYRKFCENTNRAYPPPPWWDENYILKDDYPVINVSWEDAKAYAIWCGKDLPSEIQWERVARGENNIFLWGNKIPTLKIVNGMISPSITEDFLKKFPSFRPVSIYKYDKEINKLRLKWKCYNLIGNVNEWCKNIPVFIPRKLYFSNLEYRIAKGGAYNSSLVFLYPWFKYAFLSTIHREDLGFRCVINLKY